MVTPDPDPRPLDHLALMGDPQAAALVTGEGTLDYAGLERAVGGLAGALLRGARSRRSGGELAAKIPNDKPAAAGLCAGRPCPRADQSRAQAPPVAHILADSGARLLITGEARLATLEHGDLPSDCRAVTEDEAATMFEADRLPPSDADPHSLAALLYTSGATGGRKA